MIDRHEMMHKQIERIRKENIDHINADLLHRYIDKLRDLAAEARSLMLRAPDPHPAIDMRTAQWLAKYDEVLYDEVLYQKGKGNERETKL